MMLQTEDVKNLLKEKYKNGDFRITKAGVKTVELQNIQFEVDKDWIIREPNYDYVQREIEWYKSMSLYVKDIPGKTPVIWEQCADVDGKINSNYGWMIWSEENGSQYKNCLWQLVNDPATREAVMIYNRPSMHSDAVKNHMHDFCCTFAIQCFLNKQDDDTYALDYQVLMRSNDGVFGFCNDSRWNMFVHDMMVNDLNEHGIKTVKGKLLWHAGSLHIYERHFKFLED